MMADYKSAVAGPSRTDKRVKQLPHWYRPHRYPDTSESSSHKMSTTPSNGSVISDVRQAAHEASLQNLTPLLPEPYDQSSYKSKSPARPVTHSPLKIVEQSIDEEPLETALYDLLSRTWQMFKVSPLTNLQCTEHMLNQYRKKLLELIMATEKDEEKRFNYEASVKLRADLKSQNNGPCPLEITIINNADKNELKYQGILLAWENCLDDNMDIDDHYRKVHLPVLFSRGLISMVTLVHDFLQQAFGCCVNRLIIRQIDMFAVVILVLNVIDSRDDDKMTLTFRWPHSQQKHSVDISTPTKHLYKFWTSVAGNDSSATCNTTQMNDFMVHYYKTMTKMTQMNLKKFRLMQINHKDLVLHDNYIRVKSAMIMSHLLHLINQWAMRDAGRIHNEIDSSSEDEGSKYQMDENSNISMLIST